MTRSIDSSTQTASEQSVIRPIIMIDADFTSGHLRVFSGTGTLVYNSETYYGFGKLGRISPIDEEIELSSSGVNVSLSGLPGDIISTALGEHYQGRSAVIYIALLDPDYVVIGQPVILFQGRMDNMQITLGDMAEVSLNIENPLRDWERPRERRYNNAGHQAVYPDDKGLEFVEATVEYEIEWGGNPRKKSV